VQEISCTAKLKCIINKLQNTKKHLFLKAALLLVLQRSFRTFYLQGFGSSLIVITHPTG
jgi:hypothetical protein